MKIYIDLETIPVQDEDKKTYLLENMKPPANYKSDEAIQKWKDANAENVILNTSFDGTFGQICTIGYAVGDDPVQTIQRLGEDTDAHIIQRFYDDIYKVKNPYFIAHNKEFDLRFLWLRTVINQSDNLGVQIPVDDRYNKSSFCTMKAWAGFYGKGGSLDSVCRALGIPGKQGMTGADVWSEYQAGHYQKIADYCADDVEAVRAIYKRIEFYN